MSAENQIPRSQEEVDYTLLSLIPSATSLAYLWRDSGSSRRPPPSVGVSHVSCPEPVRILGARFMKPTWVMNVPTSESVVVMVEGELGDQS